MNNRPKRQRKKKVPTKKTYQQSSTNNEDDIQYESCTKKQKQSPPEQCSSNPSCFGDILFQLTEDTHDIYSSSYVYSMLKHHQSCKSKRIVTNGNFINKIECILLKNTSIKNKDIEICQLASNDGVPDKNDKQLMMQLVTIYPYTYQFASAKLFKDREFILHFLKYFSDEIRNVPDELMKDNDFIKEALKVNGAVFQHLSRSMRLDKELILLAVRNCPHAIAWSPLLNDKNIMLEAIKENPISVYSLGNFYKYKSVLIAAVKALGSDLLFVIPFERITKQIVNIIIRREGSENLKTIIALRKKQLLHLLEDKEKEIATNMLKKFNL